MAIRVGGGAVKKVTRAASSKKCPTCHMGTVDELKNGHAALGDVIASQRLKALAKARRAKAKKSKQRRAVNA